MLLKPVPRALYLLQLNGLSLEEKDIHLESEFLMEIMELNEMLSGKSRAKDICSKIPTYVYVLCLCLVIYINNIKKFPMLISSLIFIVECNDETELRRMFDENRHKINSLVKDISEAFKMCDFVLAKHLIAQIKYFVNIEDKIKQKTYFH